MTKTFLMYTMLFAMLATACGELEMDDINKSIEQKNSISASSNNGITPLVSLSLDGISFGQSITINPSYSRYYLNAPVFPSTNLEVRSRYCNSGDCSDKPWTVMAPWKDTHWGWYRTDAAGRARIDFDVQSLNAKRYEAQVRPYGSGWAWSNTIIVNVDETPTGSEVDLAQYLDFQPGDTYLFTSKTRTAPGVYQYGNTRLQIEEDRIWCGYNVRPWRFTKDKYYSYWDPYNNRNLRWMIASPAVSANPYYRDYFWGVGHKTYKTDNLSVKTLGDFTFGISYGVTGGNIPAYNLGKRRSRIPYSQVGLNSILNRIGEDDCPNPLGNSESINYHWRTRAEFDTVKDGIFAGHDALRIDYFEEDWRNGAGQGILKESWFYVRHVGLVQILGKTFDKNGGPDCNADPDCLSDFMKDPDTNVYLKRYYKPLRDEALSVSVSKNNANFSTSICIAPGAQYHLKLNNSDFTGYLEVMARNPYNPNHWKVSKWLWVENGKVSTGPLNGLLQGEYEARFRIWAPNELDPTDPNTKDEWGLINANIPWSNTVTVNISSGC